MQPALCCALESCIIPLMLPFGCAHPGLHTVEQALANGRKCHYCV